MVEQCASQNRIGTKGLMRIESECGSLSMRYHLRLSHTDDLARALGCAANLRDHELILAAWRKWGAGLSRHLSGDFTIVIEDRNTGSIFALRDHVGSWPLFYHITRSGEFLFSDDLDQLRAAIGECPLDDDYVASAMLGGHRRAATGTFYGTIKRLPAGHCLEFSGGRARLNQWWQPFAESAASTQPLDSLFEQGRSLIADAIAARVTPDEAVGIHITGGLDSSAVIGLGLPSIRNIGGEAVGFAWQEPGSTGEGPRIAAARSFSGLDLHVPKPDLALLDELWRRDWASGRSQWNLVHELAVQRCAQGLGVKHIFSGWGGDEAISFSGRGLHAEYLSTLQLGELAALSPRRGLAGLASSVRLGMMQLTSVHNRRRSWGAGSLLSRDFLASTTPAPPRSPDMRSCRTTMQSLFGLGALTARVEDWAMSGHASGISYHYPLLDRRVMEFAYSLPSHLFRRGTTGRWFFREMMKGVLPDDLRCENSKVEELRTTALYATMAQSYRALADEVSQRRSEFSRAHYFDMDRLIAALESPPPVGNPALGHLRRAIQFLDL